MRRERGRCTRIWKMDTHGVRVSMYVCIRERERDKELKRGSRAGIGYNLSPSLVIAWAASAH
jgi:hypothetical protein